MMEAFPERAFDVGIAEQHAVTFAAGLATQGLHVFCNIYSTFLQRAYDQVIHDVCLQKLPVIFCLDRAGLVGEDGATHHGVFDISYLRCIPNLIIYAPKDEIALRNILYTAQLGLDKPIAIRYPRGRGRIIDWKKDFQKITIGKAEIIQTGEHIAVLSVGTILNNVLDALDLFSDDQKIGLFDMGFIKPLDEDLLHVVFRKYKTVITIEDGVISGGFGSSISEFAARHHYKNTLEIMGIPDMFIDQGTVAQLQEIAQISSEAIKETLQKYL